jgi:hypothetical protein
VTSQVPRQRGGCALDARFDKHAVVTTLNLDDIDLTGYDAATIRVASQGIC